MYEIKNLYSGWYLDIAQDSPLTGKYVQQYSYATPPSNNSNQRWGLYKVTRVSGNDYVIRTMILYHPPTGGCCCARLPSRGRPGGR
ncbi:MAG: hypothetical protein BHW37_05170 [Firmicutes bacterium CAG:272_52_7]|nr:MAG: hypothetical protein BHW37_05170 [Firmicutes bacterium CAG:272_52_7]